MIDDMPVPRRTVTRRQYAEIPGHGYRGAPFVQCLTTVSAGECGTLTLEVELLDAIGGKIQRTTKIVNGVWLMDGGFIDACIREIRYAVLENATKFGFET